MSGLKWQLATDWDSLADATGTGRIPVFVNTASRNWIRPRDPLVIDLDNDGIKTGTGWVKGDDGFLVLDRNGNGTIDNGGELFGVDTTLANGQKATDGIAALRDMDSNGDSIFDAADTQFGNVRVWQDLNQDGVSQSNELKTLASLGITSIDLNGHSATKNLGNGNTQTLTANVAGVGDAANQNLAQIRSTAILPTTFP